MAELLNIKNVTQIFGSDSVRKSDTTIAVDNVTFSIADDRPTITAISTSPSSVIYSSSFCTSILTRKHNSGPRTPMPTRLASTLISACTSCR